MIKRSEEMKITLRESMRGGDGTVRITDILNQDEYQGKARLLGVITLEPGTSIGEHIHENEEEVFYIIEGTATYNDNGKTEILHAGDSCVCLGGQRHSVANREKDTVLRLFAAILTY
ncbi:MAG: cupin domain-containing protein [Oscillospiraceae bacterium]|nr:cupin domain-containing protein [Oscillospiraceae bacterium]MDD6147212.1 cupin domain-containing protein [Oscillospiraceae bacterium]